MLGDFQSRGDLLFSHTGQIMSSTIEKSRGKHSAMLAIFYGVKKVLEVLTVFSLGGRVKDQWFRTLNCYRASNSFIRIPRVLLPTFTSYIDLS